MRNLSDNEVRQLLGAVKPSDAFAARDEAMLVFLLHTGLRPSEFLALNVEHVSVAGVARETLDLPASIGKCGIGRLVPLNSQARSAIETMLSFNTSMGWSTQPTSPLTYSKGGQRMCIRALQYVVAGLRKRAHLDVQATPHSARHTFASNLLGKTGNVRLVQVVLGHKHLDSTQIYAQPSRESMAAAVEQLVD